MKKIAFLSAMALSLGFTACDNYEEPNPPAQSNPQDAIFETDELSFTPSSTPLDLEALMGEGIDANLGKFSLKNFPEGYECSMVMEFSMDDKFTKPVTIETITEADSTIAFSPAVFNQAYRDNVTKNPSEVVVYARLAPYAVNGTSKVRIGDPDHFFGPFTYTITPLCPVEIEESYSLVYSTDGTTWSTANSFKFDHSDIDVYDDPKFTFTKVIPADLIGDEGLYWRIVPQSTMATGDFAGGMWFGVPEEAAYDDNGKLAARSEFAGVMFNDGPVMFNINMETRTFDYTAAYESFYTPGNANGWSFSTPALFTENYINYYGFTKLSGQFKLNPDAGWNGKDFGCQTQPTFEQNENGFYTGTGVADGGDNINVPVESLYYLELNYQTRELNFVQTESWGIIGGFNNWGSSAQMTPSDDMLTWTITQAMTAGDEWKFRANNEWKFDFGGKSFDRLERGGDNFKCTETGTYEITLHLDAYPFTATVVKK